MRIEFLRGESNPQRATVATPEGEVAWSHVLEESLSFVSGGYEFTHVEDVAAAIYDDGQDMYSVYRQGVTGFLYAIPWLFGFNEEAENDYSQSDVLIPVRKKEVVRTVWAAPWGTLG